MRELDMFLFEGLTKVWVRNRREALRNRASDGEALSTQVIHPSLSTMVSMNADPNSSESNEKADSDFEAFLARPTTLPDVTITLIGFASEELANQLAAILRAHLSIFGRILDLSGLAQVYVSYDYRSTLATLERGFETNRPLSPTEDEVAVGIAMAPAVVREGKVKSVIVLSAPHFASLLQSQETPENVSELEQLRDLVVHTLGHECGHVHDRELQARCFPEVLLKQSWSPAQEALVGTAFACWEEYIASRLSAPWGNEQTVPGFEDAFCSRLESAWATMVRSIRHYRCMGMSADTGRGCVPEPHDRNVRFLPCRSSCGIGSSSGDGGDEGRRLVQLQSSL